jgi:hypothetical protein
MFNLVAAYSWIAYGALRDVQTAWCHAVLNGVQVDAKLSEELLRQEVSEQQAQQAAALQAQLREQRHDLERVQSELQSSVQDLQSALKDLGASTESKVSTQARSTRWWLVWCMAFCSDGPGHSQWLHHPRHSWCMHPQQAP